MNYFLMQQDREGHIQRVAEEASKAVQQSLERQQQRCNDVRSELHALQVGPSHEEINGEVSRQCLYFILSLPDFFKNPLGKLGLCFRFVSISIFPKAEFLRVFRICMYRRSSNVETSGCPKSQKK